MPPDEDEERAREVRAYEQFEARHRAAVQPAAEPTDYQQITAFWARWCGLCLTVIAGLELLRQALPFISPRW